MAKKIDQLRARQAKLEQQIKEAEQEERSRAEKRIQSASRRAGLPEKIATDEISLRDLETAFKAIVDNNKGQKNTIEFDSSSLNDVHDNSGFDRG